MEGLIVEIRPIMIEDEVVEKVKKRKRQLKKLWKLILFGLIISIVFSLFAEIYKIDEQNMIHSVFSIIYAFSIFGVFLLFIPTVFTLADNRMDRSSDYIRVYTNRIECVQTINALIKDKNNNIEQATLYYEDMISWTLASRKHKSHITNFDSMRIELDNNRNISNKVSDFISNDTFHISLDGYDFNTWWSALKTAYDLASEVKDIEYWTRNSKYQIHD
ncbi:MAG: hypothetical protein GX270_14225 [Clostridiaceae bacterium]|jgi:hypothetical protein|nr:hypothetical protein [Clostridiaceae bacterium]